MEKGYLIIDIGTGNTRAAIADWKGTIVAESKVNTEYRYESINSCHFEPKKLWANVCGVIKEVVGKNTVVDIVGVTATSARQGVVLIDKNNTEIIGLPNIDNRGAYLEEKLDKDFIYELTGKWAARYFSAFKIAAYLKEYPHIKETCSTFMSISDWIGFCFTGQAAYEHTQACETSLYNTRLKKWDDDLCVAFDIDRSLLAPTIYNAQSLGKLKKEVSRELRLHESIEFIVSPADTQTGLTGIDVSNNDLAVVSGTTTPVVLVTDEYRSDSNKRYWINCYTEPSLYMVETSAGVTGLNFQRFKNNFLSQTSYNEIDTAMKKMEKPKVMCCMSTMDFATNTAYSNASFSFSTPFADTITPIDFLYAITIDMACGVYKNAQMLLDIFGQNKKIVGAGGGLKNPVFCQLICDLLQKEFILPEGFQEASILGCVKTCNKYFSYKDVQNKKTIIYEPQKNAWIVEVYEGWLEMREKINDFS